MQDIQDFTGLTMPVFTAFGWAGEEAAIKFALSQLELFIKELHQALPYALKERFPGYGLNRDTQAVYLSTDENRTGGVNIAFNARPMSLEMQLAIEDPKVLAKGLALAEQEPARCHRLVTELGPDWSLRVQQMQVDEETGEAAHYQDLFKDSVTNLDEETAVAVISKANYLNSEDQWVTPLYLSRRFPSEQISVMGLTVIKIISEHIDAVLPALNFLTGQIKTPAKSKRRTKLPTQPQSSVVTEAHPPIDPGDGFTYVAKLKSLHIRRGFINLTAEHWPFFAVNSRTETRPVTIYYNGIYDKGSSVWRLVPNDQARLVLGPAVRNWVEETFEPNDAIQIVARKLDETEIQISLKADGS